MGRRRRRLQTLFLYRPACDLLVFTHLTAYISLHLKHNKPTGGLTRREREKEREKGRRVREREKTEQRETQQASYGCKQIKENNQMRARRCSSQQHIILPLCLIARIFHFLCRYRRHSSKCWALFTPEEETISNPFNLDLSLLQKRPI